MYSQTWIWRKRKGGIRCYLRCLSFRKRCINFTFKSILAAKNEAANKGPNHVFRYPLFLSANQSRQLKEQIRSSSQSQRDAPQFKYSSLSDGQTGYDYANGFHRNPINSPRPCAYVAGKQIYKLKQEMHTHGTQIKLQFVCHRYHATNRSSTFVLLSNEHKLYCMDFIILIIYDNIMICIYMVRERITIGNEVPLSGKRLYFCRDCKQIHIMAQRYYCEELVI